MKTCLVCDQKLNRSSYTYCSNKCQRTWQYKEYIREWKLGLVDGNRGLITKNVSNHIKRYLLETYGEKCSICNWNQRHPLTNTVPLEIDHINGNAEDNQEKNLRLICPNCHSLSSTFRNLNKGKGRAWRTMKYVKSNNKFAGFA